MPRALAVVLPFMLLACADESSERVELPPESVEQTSSADVPEQPADEAGIGTPMEERVATIGLLNKRNNLSQDLEMNPGDERRIGDVIVRLQACERTAPWEMPEETGAFVQLLVRDRRNEEQFGTVFSGWLFKNSPSLNVVEHPIYDVWVKDCAMSFPGEEAEA